MLVNGQRTDLISIRDRGLLYGDGVFRTMRVTHGTVSLAKQHLHKLQQDCLRLNINCPEQSLLYAELMQLAQQNPNNVLKLIVTGGQAKRGYATEQDAVPSCIWDIFPLPTYSAHWFEQGLNVCWCGMRLATQPRLAGIKHLNRLENVLAANELKQFDEGLLLDYEGYIVEGTRTNLFWYQSGILYTPDLSLCGVAGVMRDWVLEWAAQQSIAVVIGRFLPSVLESAEEVILVNSVMGIAPVASLNSLSWSQFLLTRKLQFAWQRVSGL